MSLNFGSQNGLLFTCTCENIKFIGNRLWSFRYVLNVTFFHYPLWQLVVAFQPSASPRKWIGDYKQIRKIFSIKSR